MTLKNSVFREMILKDPDFIEAQRTYVKVVAGVEIEAGIPMPNSVKIGKPMQRVAKSMKIGDSVKLLIPEGGNAGYTASSLRYHLKKLNRKCSHRVVDDGKAVRIWRV
jgi:hypothetical protein